MYLKELIYFLNWTKYMNLVWSWKRFQINIGIKIIYYLLFQSITGYK